MSARRFLALVAALGVAHANAAGAAVARRGELVMGTILSVTVVAGDRASAESMADASIQEARRWDDALTIWRDDGELARLNLHAGRGSFEASRRLLAGLQAMLEMARTTNGSFEPNVGSLAAARTKARVPVRGIGDVLRVSEGRVALEDGAALDPGAIGKGLALDAMVALLRKGGADAAFLDFGGSSQTAIGAPPGDARGWSVLLAGSGTVTSHGSLRLRDASLSTSQAGAADTTPILDPRTGKPVEGRRLVTTFAPDATRADAWSTALVVTGGSGMPAAAADHVEALVDEGGKVTFSAGFPRPEPDGLSMH